MSATPSDSRAHLAAPAPSTATLTGAETVRVAPLNPADLLSRIWQQNLPLMRARLACLDQASQRAADGELTQAARTEAADLAHKLAGSLGMFGYPRGTEIAREIENLLENETHLATGEFLRLTSELRSVLPL